MRTRTPRLVTACLLAAAGLGLHRPVAAATPVPLTTGSYGQSFDAMLNSSTSSLPSGWAFASGTGVTWSSGTLASVTQLAGTMGSGTLTSASAGGAYLFVSGTAASGADKAVGFLTSSSFTSPRSILFGLSNSTGSTITGLDVGWTYEKYRNGTRAFDWRFFGSSDGNAWTSLSGGDKSYPADATVATIPVASSTVAPLHLTGLSIPTGAPYYLRWDYVGSGGSTNAQALGIDGFSLVVTGNTPVVSGTWWAGTPGSGIGGSGTWTAYGASFATTVAGTAFGTLPASGTAIFDGTAGQVTVAGTVAAGGLSFAVDGYAVSGGMIRLPATTTITAADGVSVDLAATLSQTSAGVTTFRSGVGASILVSGSVIGGGGLRISGGGDVVLAADNPVSGTTTVAEGWLRLGAGGATGSVAGPVALLSPAAALVIDRADDRAFANVVTGSGGFFKEGGNTVTLTGSNSFTGGTTLFAGTLVVGDGGTSGAIAPGGPLDLSAGTMLAFDRGDDVSLSGSIAGQGTLSQRGTGRLVLAQPAAAGPSFTLRAEQGVVDLDRGGASITSLLGPGNVVELVGGTLELSGSTGDTTRLTGAAILVDGNGTIALRRTGAPGDHVTTGFDAPVTVFDSGTLAFDARGNFVAPTLPPVRYRCTTILTGSVTLGTGARLAVTNSAGGTAEVILAGTILAPGGLTKEGDQTLALAGGGTIGGGARIAAGTLRLASSGILASSTATVDGGATLALGAGVWAGLRGLTIAPTGLVDVSSGGFGVAGGLAPATLVARILEGRGDGSWNGTSGITSSVAAADVAASIPRTIGWIDDGTGGVSFGYAAPGDGNIDGQVDILDAADFLAGGRFDSGLPAVWNQGDYGYDGTVDILDAADFLSTGLFDAGPYGPAAAVGTITAVPEPAPTAGLAAIAWLVSTRCWARIRRTSAIARG